MRSGVVRAVAGLPRRALIGLAGGALLALAGCSSLTPPAPGEPMLSGRLSIQVAATAAEPARGFSGQFELRGQERHGALEISGPLGAALVRAQWSGQRFVLDDGRQPRVFDSLEALAEAGLGEPLPLAALFDWLRARPWPRAPHQVRSDGIAGFEQLGWAIDTRAAAEGLLVAMRPAAPSVTLRVRLDNTP